MRQQIHQIPDNIRHGADITAAAVAGAAWIEFLPPIAAGLSMVWVFIQIYTHFENRYLAWKEKQKDDK